MRKLFTLFTLLLLCLLPVTALAAAEGAPSQLYVGNQQVSSGNDITYWTTDTSGGLVSASESDNWNVKYDPNTATLTLNEATITGNDNISSVLYGAGIYAQCNKGQPVTLTIELIGTNTITGHYGIHVNAHQGDTIGTDASLIIQSSNNGSLTVTGTGNSGLFILSGTGDASLTINDASVVASSNGSYGCAGVLVQSGVSATNSPQLSLSVNGGSLTASGTGSNAGIQFHVGNSSASATTSLTVSGNAIVDARTGGIEAYQLSTLINTNINATGTSGGIVFDGTGGTVYGDVDLQDDLTINQGETLTVPDGSSLSCNGNLTNNGTILASGGTVTGNLSGGTAVTTPSISQQPTGQTVTEGNAAEFSVTASAGDETPTYQWQQSTDNGSSWTDIENAASASYTTEATANSMNNYQYRCVVKNSSGVGVISSAATLTVTAKTEPTTYTISTANDLFDFANAVNTGNTTANAVLTADIDLGNVAWTPIGKDNSYMYTGTFDGDGHTISGLHANISSDSDSYVGLFGCIGSGGTVENVTVEASSLSASATGDNAYAYAGSVCGLNYGTITNCTSTGTVTATSDNAYAGGVCGRNYGSNSNTAAITNCTSAGTVIAEGDAAAAGGVCGGNYAEGGTATISISDYYSTGTVIATATSGKAYAGGVCGQNYAEGGTATITNCASTGAVTSTAISDIAYAGGVCGSFDGGDIKNCYSTGTVTSNATSGDAYAGGVCGYFDGGDIKNCYSTGTVTSNATPGDAYAGGVCGWNEGTITNCYWLTDSPQGGIGGGSGTVENVESKTSEQFASGEVAWLLNNKEQGTHQWAQKLGTEQSPRLMMEEADKQYDVVKVTVNFPESSSSTPKEYYININQGLKEYPVKDGETVYAFYESYDSGTYNNRIDNRTKTYGSDTDIYAKAGTAVTGITLENEILVVNSSVKLTAVVYPENASYKDYLTWESNAPGVATVDQTGTVTAVSAGTATITATSVDGSNITATCQVTVEDPVFAISVNTTRLDFSTVTEGYTEAPAAKEVTITNTGNQPLTLNQPASTSSFDVGALSKTKLAANETATFTVQPKAGLAVGTYSEDITVSGDGGATMTITASFNIRKEVEVKASGSTNLSFTTDRDEFTLTATVYAQGNVLNPTDGSWKWTVAGEDVVALSGSPTLLRAFASSSRQAFTVEGTGTTTITATYDDGTYRGSVDFTVRISKPTPPDPISYYNIYVEDVCDGVEVTTSKNVVREGGSISLYVEKDTADYDFDNFQVYYKRSYYGPWEVLEEGTQPGEYPINNIWTHIYIKAEGAVEKEDPTGIEQVEGVKVYTKDGSLYVQTPQREQVLVITMTGVVVKNEEQVGLKQYHGLQPGIYIVRIGDRAYKVRLN